MAGKSKPKVPGRWRREKGGSASFLKGISLLHMAWAAVLLTTLTAVGFFLVAFQEGGPRRGGGLTLTLEALGEAITDGESSFFKRRGARVTVVITGLGLAREATRRAIDELPAEVALSFSPYAKDLQLWLQQARDKGHEVLLDLPMEPTSFPKQDPGPRGLMTLLEPEQNLERLDWVLRRGEGYIGLVASMGSAYLASKKDLAPVFEVLQSRGLMFLDNGASAKSVSRQLAKTYDLHHLSNDRSLDDKLPNRQLIKAGLEEIEALAKDRGDSVAIGRPYPATLESVAAWAAGLKERGVTLARLSSLAGLPTAQQAQRQSEAE